MISINFLDITFCSYYKTCKDGKNCKRALTDEIRLLANREGVPLSIFLTQPYCYRAKKEKRC